MWVPGLPAPPGAHAAARRGGAGPWPPAARRHFLMNAHWLAPARLHTASASLPVAGGLPRWGCAAGCPTAPPLTPAGLRGKVVLAGFWTYTCINWLRQLPYLRAWADKYSGHGLVVIGVHTPEFGFEHDPDNVRRA